LSFGQRRKGDFPFSKKGGKEMVDHTDKKGDQRKSGKKDGHVS